MRLLAGDVPKEVGVSISSFSCKVCFDRRIQVLKVSSGSCRALMDLTDGPDPLRP